MDIWNMANFRYVDPIWYTSGGEFTEPVIQHFIHFL